MKHHAPPWWLIFAMLGVAFALVLSGCSVEFISRMPQDSVMIYRCERDNRSSSTRQRTSIDVWRSPDGGLWVAYQGQEQYAKPISRDMTPKEACLP